jgi:hypothetical protein
MVLGAVKAAGYEAGGEEFHRALEDVRQASPPARLPGSGGAQVGGLPFVDPKTQGSAGIV